MSEPVSEETCGCCTGTSVRTPATIWNRPGLPEIAYRSGTYSDFLASMVAGLSRKDRPALAGLRTRDADDPSIALLDAWAIGCDVLTFYSERLANETFLRTSTERTSLQELGKLVAYRLSPGVAAETWLAFAFQRPPLPLPDSDTSSDPGQEPPAVPDAVLVPAGLRVQSVPGPGEVPQTFETADDVEARHDWNALPVVRTTPYPPDTAGRSDAYLAGVDLNLEEGDAILFAGTDVVNDYWDVRLLTDVEVDIAGRRTHVTWDHGLGSASPSHPPAGSPSTFVLRKRLAVFGHNAPIWAAMNGDFRVGYQNAHKFPSGADQNEWPSFVAVTGSGSTSELDLDGAHPDVVRGSWVVVSQDAEDSFYRELYQVVERAELSRAEFGVSGKVTRLKLDGEPHAFGSPRDVTVMAVSHHLTVVEAPDPSALSGLSVTVEGDATAMEVGRALVLAGRSPAGDRQSEVVTLASVAAAVGPKGPRTVLGFDAALQYSYDRSTAVLHGNVARATNGESVTQILGSGDARQPFRTLSLQQAPLTFVPAENPRGSSSTLEVQVDGLAWSERPSTYATEPDDRIFVTREEPNGSVSVVFGDGVHGSRPSSGSNNVRATYRKGIGAGGNLKRNQLTQALDRPLGLKGVSNPVAATGGVDPEAPEHARVSIPIPVKTLGRAVSLLDFADYALAFTGIAKASAAVLTLRPGKTVVVTVSDADGKPPPQATLDRLAASITAETDPNVRVQVLACRPADFRIALKVKVDPDREPKAVLAAVEHAVRAAYGRPARSLGAPVHSSAVVAAVASVAGVLAVDLDRLYRTGTSPALADDLVADPARVGSGQALAVELLAISDDDLDWLQEMP